MTHRTVESATNIMPVRTQYEPYWREIRQEQTDASNETAGAFHSFLVKEIKMGKKSLNIKTGKSNQYNAYK